MKNPLQNLKPFTEKFNGIYRGVVENNVDPETRGRLQIRIFGVHTEDPTLLTTAQLPWAEAATDLIQGGSTGKGSFVIPLIGTMLWCFFEAGEHMYPVYFASCSSFPTDQRYGMDPNLAFFKGEEPDTTLLNEPDWNRYARDNDDIPCVSTRDSYKTQNVPIAGGGTWNELSISNLTTYPNKNVISLKSGFTVAMEDTPDTGYNHSFVWHPSNSYIDVRPAGTTTIKTTYDFYHVVSRDLYQYIINNIRITCGAARYLKVGSSEIKDVGSSQTTNIGGSQAIDVASTYELDSGSTIDITAGGVMTLTSNGATMELVSTIINLNGMVNMI